MIEWFGDEIYIDYSTCSKEINKEKIADVIFNDDLALSRIVKLIKGGLIRIFHDWCYEIEYCNSKDVPFILYESAILDKELYNMFDYIIIVDADKDIRERRVLERSGLSKQKFNERDCKQIKTEDILKKLDRMSIPCMVIENNGEDILPLIKCIINTINKK